MAAAGTAGKGLSGNKAGRGIFPGETEVINSSLGGLRWGRQVGVKVKRRGCVRAGIAQRTWGEEPV